MPEDIKASSITEAIGTILAKLCYKVADDIGTEFADHTNKWRAENAGRLLEKTNAKYDQHSITGNETALPRLVHRIIGEGSWIEDDQVQDMWAGLLASACTEDGDDESNLIFINILSQITSMQVNIINYACKNSEKHLTKAGWILSKQVSIELEELRMITGIDDFHRFDRELDHLRELGLIRGEFGGAGGFRIDSTNAIITPTPLALQMYARCQGYKGSPVDYFGISAAEQATPAVR